MTAGETSDKIAAAARLIVDKEGSDAASMRRIAAAIGVTPMTIYRHYADRDDLMEAVAATAFDEIAGMWAERHAAAGGPAGIDSQIFAAADELVDLALTRPNLYAFLFTERRASARRFPHDFEASQSPTLTILAEILTEGMQIGRFRSSDVWELALTLAATLHGLIHLHNGGRIRLPDTDFKTLCRSAVERILDGIRA